MYIPEYCYCFTNTITATRGHDISCSILSSTESTASTIPRTGLKRMGLTLLLIMIYIFVGIKIIAACSACICNWEVKLSAERCYRPMLTYSTLRIQSPMSAYRSYRRWTFTPKPIEIEWCLTVGNWKQLFCPFPVCPFLFPSNFERT